MNLKGLVHRIESTDSYFKNYAARSIDRYLTTRNWLFGFYIIVYEQKGEDRAQYGEALLSSLAQRLKLKGMSQTNLKLFRQFYQVYPTLSRPAISLLKELTKGQALSDKFDEEKSQTLTDELQEFDLQILDSYEKENDEFQIAPEILLDHLSFSHFVELLKIQEPLRRFFYEVECIKAAWSVRELKKQIAKLSFERTAASIEPRKVKNMLQLQAQSYVPEEIIKTPYVFDFLGLPEKILGSESELEDQLIMHLRDFILELGNGFCFEARQKRVVIGGEYFFIDLVFYHRLLKCHVLLELKIDAFNHQHAGQLNTYLQYYKKNILAEHDNPPIGILLCTTKNEELAEYALGGMDPNIFIQEYKTALPDTKDLEAFLRTEKDNFNL